MENQYVIIDLSSARQNPGPLSFAYILIEHANKHLATCLQQSVVPKRHADKNQTKLKLKKLNLTLN